MRRTLFSLILGSPSGRQRCLRRHPRPLIPLEPERLEVRSVMSGDAPVIPPPMPTLALDTPIVTTITASDVGEHVDGNSSELLSRFESRESFENWLIEAAVVRWKHLFGKPDYPVIMCGRPSVTDSFVGLEALPAIGARLTQGANLSVAFSGWSHQSQVQDVDEIDLIETDGTYLYAISGRSLVIIGGLQSGQPQVVSRIDLDPAERPLGIFLTGGRIAVVSASGGGVGGFVMRGDGIRIRCGWEPWTPTRTVVTVFDVADRSAPSLVQRTSMDGSLVTSRVVDGQLRLVLNAGLNPPPLARLPIDPLPTGMSWWQPRSRYETEAEYVERIRAGGIDALMPMVRTLDGAGNVLQESPLVSPVDVWHRGVDQCRNLTVLATFDLNSDGAGPTDTVGVVTAGEVQVYATADSVYVFDGRWTAHGPRTDVRQFTFSQATHGIELASQGTFAGQLLNQFAVDEREGRLRVVVEGLPDGHAVHVLERHGETLEVAGSLSGLAAGESLYAVRFVGDRAYFVTFRQVDPLFVVDFTDPVKPTVRGVLHIPGFSDSLIPIDDDLLLAVGRDADEQTGVFGDLQISLFDVSDPGDPKLLDRYAFAGGRGTTTPLTGTRWVRGDGDHMAAGYDAAKGLFTLPVDAGGDMWWRGEPASGGPVPVTTGLHTFRINPRGRIEPLGVITHADLVTRAVRIEDKIVAVSPDAVSVHKADDPEACLGAVALDESPGIPLGDVARYKRPIVLPAVEDDDMPSQGNDEAPVASGEDAGGPVVRADSWFAFQIDAQTNGLGNVAGGESTASRSWAFRSRRT